MNVAATRREKAKSFTFGTSRTTADDNCGVRQYSSTSLDALGKTQDTVGQPKPCEKSTRAVVRRALVAESGKKGRVQGSEADLAQCGTLALPPPFLFCGCSYTTFFNAPFSTQGEAKQPFSHHGRYPSRPPKISKLF